MKITSIHQFTPVLAKYDAIGKTILEIQALLKSWGYISEIYVETPIDQTAKITYRYDEYKPQPSDLVIYHHSIGSILADFTSKLKIKKILCYHNITPEKFFEKYDKGIANQLYDGRKQLQKLSNDFKYVMAASVYTKQELQQNGFQKILPFNYFINLERFDKVKIKKEIVSQYNDSTNILFVGRRVPNKKIDDLLKIFAYYKIINPKSRLFILGGSWAVESYQQELDKLVQILKLKDLIFINTLTDEELASYYSVADLFLCMSEHEGFCIPLAEAMYFGVPIVAYNSSAVPDTMDSTGILVNHKRFNEIAELLDIMMSDEELRNEIILKQKERIKSFTFDQAASILHNNVDLILNSS